MEDQPHVAVCPGAGMGHLSVFLGLASTLSSAPNHTTVTLVIIVPILTTAESDRISSFFTSHPNIRRLDFHIPLPSPDPSVDPFFSRYDTINRSGHHLPGLLSSLSPPLSAVFSEFTLVHGLNSNPIPFPNYTVIITSARFFSFMAYLPNLVNSLPQPGQSVDIPGLAPFPYENIPSPFFSPDHIFNNTVLVNSRSLSLSKGIIINTLDSFEPLTLSALKSRTALPHLPPIYPIGPVYTEEEEEDSFIRPNRDSHNLITSWLDEQPEKSVVYLSFGNRTATSREQIKEVGMGLERGRWRFLWVVKTSMVDKEDKEELVSLFGEEMYEKLCKKGKVVKWARQEEVLAHKAVGGFVTHCGWNSVMEAVRFGVPMLGWPQLGDQMENARAMEEAGVGVCGWGGGSGRLVEAADFEEKVERVMGMEGLRERVNWLREEMIRAREVGGTSRDALATIVASLRLQIHTQATQENGRLNCKSVT